MRALGVVRQLTTSDSLARGRVDYLLLLACTFVSHISCFRKYDIYHTYKRNNIISKYCPIYVLYLRRLASLVYHIIPKNVFSNLPTLALVVYFCRVFSKAGPGSSTQS